MIPDLAMIVAAYVIFRAFQTFLESPSQYRNQGAQVFVWAAAGILILFTVVMIADVVSKGTTTTLPGLP